MNPSKRATDSRCTRGGVWDIKGFFCPLLPFVASRFIDQANTPQGTITPIVSLYDSRILCEYPQPLRLGDITTRLIERPYARVTYISLARVRYRPFLRPAGHPTKAVRRYCFCYLLNGHLDPAASNIDRPRAGEENKAPRQQYRRQGRVKCEARHTHPPLISSPVYQGRSIHHAIFCQNLEVLLVPSMYGQCRVRPFLGDCTARHR